MGPIEVSRCVAILQAIGVVPGKEQAQIALLIECVRKRVGGGKLHIGTHALLELRL